MRRFILTMMLVFGALSVHAQQKAEVITLQETQVSQTLDVIIEASAPNTVYIQVFDPQMKLKANAPEKINHKIKVGVGVTPTEIDLSTLPKGEYVVEATSDGRGLLLRQNIYKTE